MELITFTDDRQLLKEFIDFGYQLYAGDRHFIPPKRKDLQTELSCNGHAMRHPGNEMVHFLAKDHGNVVGRVSALVNRDLRDRDGTPIGTIGFFECVDEYTIAHALLESAVQWLVDRHRLQRIWGPMNFDIWHGYRFKTAGFQERPFTGEPYNKPYYPGLFVRYGFSVRAEWDSLRVSGRETISNMIRRGERRYRLLCDRGYRFEHIHPSRLADQLPKLHRILSSSFAEFLGYTEISEVEFTSLLKKSESAFDTDLAALAYNERDELAGFAIAYRELADAVLAMRGTRNAWSLLRYAYHRLRSKTINFYIGGATPEEIARRSGLGRAGFYYIIQRALDKGFDTVLLTLRRKGNLAHGLAARSGCVPQCEYALYEWNHG